MDWFLYDNGLRHERVNYYVLLFCFFQKKVLAQWTRDLN